MEYIIRKSDVLVIGGGLAGLRAAYEARRSSRPAKGNDLNANISMTLMEAYQGSQRMLDLNGNTIKITIKPGVRDGQVLRIKGKGNPGRNGGDNGDLLIKVSIINDHVYQRDGDDLIRNINIDIYTAILTFYDRHRQSRGSFGIMAGFLRVLLLLFQR